MQKILLFLLITISSFSQQKQSLTNTIRPEFMLGKSIPSYTLFTGKNPQIVAGVSYEHKNTDNSIERQTILNNPTTGIGLFYTNYGTNIKGQSISLIPFIEFHPINNYKWSTKFGMGTTYFDTKYHFVKNPENKAVSSNFTWAIQGFLYYDTQLKNEFDLRLGLGVFHHSNGHTKLPNDGLNTALLSLSTSFELNNKILKNNIQNIDKKSINTFSDFFYETRIGYGFQAFINEKSSTKPVYAFSIKGGVYYKNIIKLSFGSSYRFYQHYYDYILENDLTNYIEKPKWNSSNINLFVGAEATLGHLGIDWELGANIHKPFYNKHYSLQKSKSQKQYTLKKLLFSRLGLKIYMNNTKNKPNNNIYVAAHINSNFGQADFTELSLGFVHRIKRKKE